MELLLATPTGSRLYGLAHADSDNDTFEVYAGKRRMSQKLNGKEDVVRVSLNQFLDGLGKGVPQYLEALWSPQKTVNSLSWLDGYHPGYSTTANTYLRTIKSFWRAGDFKHRRHSARLFCNLQDFLEYGRFDPVLTEEQRAWVDAYAYGALDYPRL